MNDVKQIKSSGVTDSELEGIVFLDADGVVTPGRSSWRLVHEAMGTLDEAQKHYKQYKNGELTFAEWGKRDAALWAGQPVETVRQAAKSAGLMEGAREAVSELHVMGLKTGIVSAGITQFAEEYADQLGVDFVVANRLETKNGTLTGEVEMLVTDESKSRYVKTIAEEHSIPMTRTVAVGDTAHDIKKFNSVGLSIAFNPHEADDNSNDADSVVEVADESVEETDLREIVPLVRDWLEDVKFGES